jgi:hypothetical protein
MSVQKLFISYSHDSLEHKKWVLELGTRIRLNGIDAILDQWELTPGDDLPHFMETHLAAADYILMVCTDRYVEKANLGSGGVGYEKMIITSNLMTRIDENKIIPILRQKGSFEVPTFLKTKLYIDFSKDDDYEFSFDELVRKVHKSPIFKKPEIGNNPFKNPSVSDTTPQHDSIKELMKIVIEDYEQGEDYSQYSDLYARLEISRIMLDFLIIEAKKQKLVKQDGAGDLILLDAGKFYAIQNGLTI